MSRQHRCDQCGHTATVEHASSYWFALLWPTGEVERTGLFNAETPVMERREFCGVACVGLWAAMAAAVEGMA